jgi:hypothetical protein
MILLDEIKDARSGKQGTRKEAGSYGKDSLSHTVRSHSES